MNFEKTPTKVEVETFWNSAWGPEKDYNEETEWLKRNEERCEEAFRKAQVWKLPVIDKVLFDSIHENIKTFYSQCSTVCENLKVKCGKFQADSLSSLLSVWH